MSAFLFDLLPPDVERMIQQNVEYKKNFSECLKNIASIGEHTAETKWSYGWKGDEHFCEADQTCFLYQEFDYGCRLDALQGLTVKRWGANPRCYSGYSGLIDQEERFFNDRFDWAWRGDCGIGFEEGYDGAC
jgi:hypothetical protein